jgi:uncharacterized membrane-anchored protein
MVVLVCLLQLVLVAVAVWPQLSARLTGEEYRLAVAPVDPIDPFRGAYVTLDYPGLSRPSDSPPSGELFVPLQRATAGDVWEPLPAQLRRPAGGPYLRCDSDGWRLRCGIESLFASQREAKRLERELAVGDAVARVRVDGRGNAAVVAVERG